MTDFVYPRLSAGSTVTVNGYTDVIGSEEYNQKLSQERADAVTAALQAHLGEETDVRTESIGHGEVSPQYSNDTPEGRFYNRTVNLLIEKFPD
jgi:OOP family OmpA-OmpF porin